MQLKKLSMYLNFLLIKICNLIESYFLCTSLYISKVRACPNIFFFMTSLKTHWTYCYVFSKVYSKQPKSVIHQKCPCLKTKFLWIQFFTLLYINNEVKEDGMVHIYYPNSTSRFLQKKCNSIGYSVYNSEVLLLMKLLSGRMLTNYF